VRCSGYERPPKHYNANHFATMPHTIQQATKSAAGSINKSRPRFSYRQTTIAGTGLSPVAHYSLCMVRMGLFDGKRLSLGGTAAH
jgi:hypothetical protein